uniref:Uncharacterized protein n=1 Tax=Vespula pensylvanica TaxID=30213 RepID=A0A834JYS6_VESPE|nr:hypothetical protein H0235_016716 [Vespula pensylvanica]
MSRIDMGDQMLNAHQRHQITVEEYKNFFKSYAVKFTIMGDLKAKHDFWDFIITNSKISFESPRKKGTFLNAYAIKRMVAPGITAIEYPYVKYESSSLNYHYEYQQCLKTFNANIMTYAQAADTLGIQETITPTIRNYKAIPDA